MSRDPRYTAVQNSSSTALTLLAGGTVVLTSFGLKLLAAGFLDQAALNSILDTPSHNHDKAYKLLQCVIAQVKTSPELFYEKYLQVLEQCPPLCALLDSIRQEYDRLQGQPTADKSNSTEATDRPHSPLQLPGPHSGNTSESSTGTEPESLPIPEPGPGFICPCGKCDLWKYLEGKCPEQDSESFPYLDKENLTQRQKDILKEELVEESRVIKQKFVLLVQNTMKWLTKQIDPAFTPMQLKKLFLNDVSVEMKNSESYTYEDIFDAFKSNHCWSWFSFDTLKSIIELMSNFEMTVEFTNYEKAFNEYCSQRKLYECPTCFSPILHKLNRPVLIEFPEDIDDITLFDLKKKLERKLARIIGVKERDFVLLTYKDGSTVLVYSLPRSVADKVFPLSPEQKEMLAKIGVSKCYLYSEPTNQTKQSIPEEKDSEAIHVTEDGQYVSKPKSGREHYILQTSESGIVKEPPTEKEEEKEEEPFESFNSDSKRFQCPCGRCEIWDYLEGKCPQQSSTKLPQLSTTDLKSHELQELELKVKKESENIIFQFDKLVAETEKWLSESKNLKFTPNQLKGAGFLRRLRIVDLESAKSFADIFRVLQESYCWSWFQFDVLKKVIVFMSKSKDKRMLKHLKSYKKKFEEYCLNRNLYDCPWKLSEANRKLHCPLIVEFPTTDIKLQHLKKDFELELREILGIRNQDLILLTHKNATVLIYSLPRPVANKAFPLSSVQKETLQKINANCYLCPESTNQDQESPKPAAEETAGLKVQQKTGSVESLPESLSTVSDLSSTISDCSFAESEAILELEPMPLETLKELFRMAIAENAAKYGTLKKRIELYIKNQYGVQFDLEKPKHNLVHYQIMAKEMDRKVDILTTRLQSYKDSIRHLEEQPSKESDELLVKMESELNMAEKKKEEAWRRVSVEDQRLKNVKQQMEPDPSRCRAEGPGITKAFVNSIATFYVSVRDHNNRPCTVPYKLTAELKFKDNFTVEVEKVSYDTNKGLCNLRYTATKRGRYELHVAVNGFSIQGSAFEVEASIPPITGFNFPWGIAINSQSKMTVVSEYTGDRISLLSDKGVKCLIDNRHVKSPQGIAFDMEGCIYVCDEDNCVKKFKPDGTFLKSSAKHLLNRPRGLKINNKKLYVCDRFNYKIKVFDTELNYLSISIGGLGVFRDPWDISFDSQSNLYVTDNTLNRIKVFDQEGMYLQEFGERGSNDGQFRGPTCIHIHKDLVYVSDYGNNRVSVFNTSGEPKYNFGKFGTAIGEFYTPRGIAIDEEGLVYVCDLYNSRVQVFDLSYISS